MFFSTKHHIDSLLSFSKNCLLSIGILLQLNIGNQNISKKDLIEKIVTSFNNRCIVLVIKPNNELINICHSKSLLVNQCYRSAMLASILDNEYSNEIFKSFCKPNDINWNIKKISRCDLPYVCSGKDLLIPHQLLSSGSIKNIFMQLHPSQRLSIGKIFKELTSTLTLAFHEHENILCQYPMESLAQLIYAIVPLTLNLHFHMNV